MNRPTWDAYFLTIAHAVATRSPCVKRQVGAVLVSDDRAILATGYNGPPRGAPHRLAEARPGFLTVHDNSASDLPADPLLCVRVGIPSGERADVVCCAHAEINAIAQAARHGVPVKGATLYVTTSPCAWCARSIVNAGVVRVVREGDYADPVAATVFAESNVPVLEMKREPPDDAPPGHYYVERLAFIARRGDSPVERVLVKREPEPEATVAEQRDALVQMLKEREAEIGNLELDLAQARASPADVRKLAECMGLPAGGRAMAEISDEIQKHAPWNGRDRCDAFDVAFMAWAAPVLASALNGPFDATPVGTGNALLDELVQRIVALRAELWATHTDLGEKTTEIVSLEAIVEKAKLDVEKAKLDVDASWQEARGLESELNVAKDRAAKVVTRAEYDALWKAWHAVWCVECGSEASCHACAAVMEGMRALKAKLA